MTWMRITRGKARGCRLEWVGRVMSDVQSEEQLADDAGRKLSLGKKLLFALILAGMLFGVLEVGIRMAAPMVAWSSAHWVWDDGVDARQDSDEWPNTYPKNATGRHVYIEFDVSVAFNADGFRGPEFDESVGPVVIFIGDSTTMGHGIAYEDSFARIVEQGLREKFGAFDVWNLGRSGSGPVVQYLLLDRILKKYPNADVRAVVMVTGMSVQHGAGNDLVDMQRNLAYIDGGRPPKGRKTVRWWSFIRGSAVLHGIEMLLAKWRRENVRLSDIADWDGHWKRYTECVDRVHALCRERDIPLLLTYLSGRASEKLEDIATIRQHFDTYAASRESVGVAACTPKLADELTGKLWYYPIDGHINTAAHAYCAEQIGTVLFDQLQEASPTDE